MGKVAHSAAAVIVRGRVRWLPLVCNMGLGLGGVLVGVPAG